MISNKQIDVLFPFYIQIDEDLMITSVGKSLNKIYPNIKGQKFLDHFEFKRPSISISSDYDSIISNIDQVFILKAKTASSFLLRGQIIKGEDFSKNELLFFGSPWITSLDKLNELNLMLNDFALHDSVTDLLQLLNVQEVSQKDIKILAENLRDQRDILKATNEEIEKIAKFPEENPNPVLRFDFEGTVLYTNLAADGLISQENEHFLVKIKAIVHKTVKSDERIEVDIRVGNKCYAFVFHKNNAFKYINAYGRDITENKMARKKLEEQKVFYESILNNLPSDIVAFDSEHRYTFINPIAIKDSETRSWLIGKDDFDYCKHRSKDMSIAETRRAKFLEVVKSKSVIEWEDVTVNDEGRSIYNLRRLKPVYDNLDNLIMVIGYGIDVTNIREAEERIKASEERYKKLVEDANDIIYRTDYLGNFIYANPIALRILGKKKEEVLGRHFSELVRKDFRERAIKFYQEQFTNRNDITYFEFPLKLEKDEVWLGQNVKVLEQGGQIIGFQAVARDVTEIRRIQKSLEKARQKAESSLRAKENFLANMSHEIRTPLNSILGMSELLEEAKLTASERKQLHAIQKSGKSLMVIINDILDFSKIESGKLNFELIGFKPIEIIRSVISSLEYKVVSKDVFLSFNVGPVMKDLIVLGDPTRLNQILVNLVNNAIKFTEYGFVTVKSQVVKRTKGVVNILFIVEDTGIGIEEENVSKIFESFSQADYSTTRKYGGTGLGLAISRKLVVSQGGKIWVESEMGKGSKFMFELEYQIGEKKDLINNISEFNEEVYFEGSRVLVAEDNNMNQLYVQSVLDKYGVTTVMAENGEETIEKLKEGTFHLILMDMQMPKMGGVEATKVIRKEINKEIPIVALTANAIKGTEDKCIEAGMNGFLSKPFLEKDLVYVLTKYLKPAGGQGNNIFMEEEISSSENTIPIKNGEGEVLYSLKDLEEIGGNNPNFMKKMIGLFLEQVPVMLQNMDEAFLQNDLSRLGNIAHKLKPSIDMMGIISLKDVIRSLEINAKKETELDSIPLWLEKVDVTLNQVLEQLKATHIS